MMLDSAYDLCLFKPGNKEAGDFEKSVISLAPIES